MSIRSNVVEKRMVSASVLLLPFLEEDVHYATHLNVTTEQEKSSIFRVSDYLLVNNFRNLAKITN